MTGAAHASSGTKRGVIGEALTGAARSPLIVFGCSSAAALVALALALQATRPSAGDALVRADDRLHTPERVAETFVEAYRTHDFARAARLSAGPLARALRARARREPRSAGAQPADVLVLQESYVLSGQRLRLAGVLARSPEEEASGWPISLTLARERGRFRVQDLSWPKGPPPAP